MIGMETNVQWFDDIFHRSHGLRPGLVLLSAPPGMGKTALALNVTLACLVSGHHVGYFALDNTADEIEARLLSLSTTNRQNPEREITSYDIEFDELTDKQLEIIKQKRAKLSEYLDSDALQIWDQLAFEEFRDDYYDEDQSEEDAFLDLLEDAVCPIAPVDTLSRNEQERYQKCLAIMAGKCKCDEDMEQVRSDLYDLQCRVDTAEQDARDNRPLVIIDYLQRIPGFDEKDCRIICELKKLALKYNVSILIISSLTKSGEVRGSGQIRYEISAELELRYPDRLKKVIKEKRNTSEYPVPLILWIGKNRWGDQYHDIRLGFYSQTTGFIAPMRKAD